MTIRPDAEVLAIEGYEPDMVMSHVRLLSDVNFVEFATPGALDGTVYFQRLTWAGHDYLDAIRDPEIWRKTKQGTDAVGGLTLDLVKDLAKGFLKTKFEEHTGVKL